MARFTTEIKKTRQRLLDELDKHTRYVNEQLAKLDEIAEHYSKKIEPLTKSKVALPRIPKRRGRPPKEGATRGKGSVVENFNVTQAVRDIIAEHPSDTFTVADIREAFQVKHKGMLERIHRVALSLALQSLTRLGEISSKKNPESKRSNLFRRLKRRKPKK
jgi:hypothetical protein